MQYTVKVPLFGFEEVQTVTFNKIDDVFASIKAEPDGTPSFTLVNPYALQTYQFEIPKAIQVLMQITNESNILVYNTVVIHNPIQESTVNFLAPIIFNTDNQTMVQMILDGTKYPEYGINVPIKNYLNT